LVWFGLSLALVTPTNMSESANLSEETFNCGICFELLIDPTTLTCGHSICRYCLAQWWYKSKKNTCPECRQVWEGFPKVNVTLRNTISTLYPNHVKERFTYLEGINDYKHIKQKFEDYGKAREPSLGSNVNWTLICVLVAITIAIAVVINVGMKKYLGSSQIDLMSKSFHDWSPEDVGLWIGGLGVWAKNKYDKKFVEGGIDGSLLVQITENDLTLPPLEIAMPLQRRIILDGITKLKNTLPHHSSGFWEYKERRSGMITFIMFGLKEFPRSTLAYLYLFNYYDIFLPIFYGTITMKENYTTVEIMKKSDSPSIEHWIEFIPKYLCIPYYLVGTFATRFLDINYWTSRVVILHSLLMTITEFTKSGFLFTGGTRQLPYLGLKYFIYIIVTSAFFKFFWPFVPFFIADCIFYWMLYVSPFDALNRLRRTIMHRNEAGNNVNNPPQQQHVHNNFIRNNGARGWHFNFEWNTR